MIKYDIIIYNTNKETEMDHKKSLILYAKALLLFIMIVVVSNYFVKSGVNDNNGLVLIGYLIYWGLVFVADIINNKK